MRRKAITFGGCACGCVLVGVRLCGCVLVGVFVLALAFKSHRSGKSEKLMAVLDWQRVRGKKKKALKDTGAK